MIDVKQVRELVELMVEHGLSEVRIREGETMISLRRGPGGDIVAAGAPMAMMQVPGFAAPPVAGPAAPSLPLPPSPDEGLVPIVSPMVGTFYAAPDPESSPFVQVGSEVNPDSPVCVIEAMKVFNEIKAEVAGTIVRIMAQNQQAVEFGQRLMMVRPHS